MSDVVFDVVFCTNSGKLGSFSTETSFDKDFFTPVTRFKGGHLKKLSSEVTHLVESCFFREQKCPPSVVTFQIQVYIFH